MKQNTAYIHRHSETDTGNRYAEQYMHVICDHMQQRDTYIKKKSEY